jgi:transposase
MAVRGLGCPVRFTLTAGQKGDAPQAAALIEGLPAEVVMADTAYDADHLRQAIAAKGVIAVIPNNPSRALKYPLDKHLYAQRHLVECCFSKLKQFRRVATRFEKTARNYRAVITLAPITLWMRQVSTPPREQTGRDCLCRDTACNSACALHQALEFHIRCRANLPFFA